MLLAGGRERNGVGRHRQRGYRAGATVSRRRCAAPRPRRAGRRGASAAKRTGRDAQRRRPRSGAAGRTSAARRRSSWSTRPTAPSGQVERVLAERLVRRRARGGRRDARGKSTGSTIAAGRAGRDRRARTRPSGGPGRAARTAATTPARHADDHRQRTPSTHCSAGEEQRRRHRPDRRVAAQASGTGPSRSGVGHAQEHPALVAVGRAVRRTRRRVGRCERGEHRERGPRRPRARRRARRGRRHRGPHRHREHSGAATRSAVRLDGARQRRSRPAPPPRPPRRARTPVRATARLRSSRASPSAGPTVSGRSAHVDAGGPGTERGSHAWRRDLPIGRADGYSVGAHQGGSMAARVTRGRATMKAVDLRPGLASSIGSLPHTDPRAAATVRARAPPEAPGRPSLPNRSGVERMIAQAAWGIPGRRGARRRLAAGRRPAPRPAGAAAPTPGIDGEPFVGAARLPRRGRRPAGARSSCSSPARSRSASRSTRSASRPARPSPSPAPRCGPGPARSWPPPRRPRRWRRSSCSSTSPASPPPCTPASRSTRTAPSTSCRARSPRSSPTPITGLHCCGPADWRVVLQAGPQILSLPLDAGAERPRRRPRRVPRARRLGGLGRGAHHRSDRLHARAPLAAAVGRVVRAHRGRLRSGPAPRAGLITPACGLAGHGEAQADLVLSLTNQVARRLETQTLGMRLTVGA